MSNDPHVNKAHMENEALFCVMCIGNYLGNGCIQCTPGTLYNIRILLQHLKSNRGSLKLLCRFLLAVTVICILAIERKKSSDAKSVAFINFLTRRCFTSLRIGPSRVSMAFLVNFRDEIDHLLRESDILTKIIKGCISRTAFKCFGQLKSWT